MISLSRDCITVWIPKTETERSHVDVNDVEEREQEQHLPEGKQIPQSKLTFALFHPTGSNICTLLLPCSGSTHHLVSGFTITTILSMFRQLRKKVFPFYASVFALTFAATH